MWWIQPFKPEVYKYGQQQEDKDLEWQTHVWTVCVICLRKRTEKKHENS